MKRKVFALILSCIMALSLVVSAATYSDVSETHDRYEAINQLSSMDIITGFPDGTFKPDEAVTRAQMAALITRMFNLTSSQVTAEPFPDVAVDYWAAANIVAAKDMKIINGFPDGTFKPEESVTYEQAVKMIVCALNYGTAAEALGGYPNGYITQASKLNILKKAASSNTEPAPRGIIAQLLFNSLDVDMLVARVNADGTVDYVKSESGNNTVQEQFHKTQKLTAATVVRTPKVNLEPTQAAIQNVNDNAMFVKTANGEYVKLVVDSYTDAFGYIGQVVDISYRQESGSDVKTLTSITRNSSVMVYENIRLSDVSALTASGMTYYTDKANDRTMNIKFSGTPVVIYNERLHTTGINAINTDLTSTAGHIYADGVISAYVGNGYTLIKAKSYKTYVVESVDTRNESIKVKGAVVGGAEQANFDISLPYKDTYINETVLKRGTFDFAKGAAASDASTLSSLSSISKGNIISIAVNTEDASNRYYEVLVSSVTKTGTVTECYTDDATSRSVIKIDDSTPYLFARELARYEMDTVISNETTATFCLDVFGQVGYVKDIQVGSASLGLPVSVTVGGSGFDKITQLEIYNVDSNRVETLRFRDEVSGDPRVAVLKDGSGNLITDSLFKYTLKNGQINTLEAVAAGTDDYTYIAAKTAANTISDIKMVSSTKITFDSGKEITYNSSSTKVIQIGYASDTSKVTPKTATMVTNTLYTGKVYQMNNKKTGTSYNLQYVIIRPYEGLVIGSPVCIVDSVGRTTMKGDTSVVTISAYPFQDQNTAGVSSAVQEITLTETVANALQLKVGDVFAYYKVPTTDDVDIETLKNIYILARASEIAAGTYPTAGTLTATDNVQNSTGGYNRNYRYLGILSGSSQLVGPSNTSGVYNYYMGTPLAYIDSDGTDRGLRVSKDNVSNMPILPGDTTAIAAIEADLDNSSRFFDYNIKNLANIFIYDATASSDAEKLEQIKGKDEIRNYLISLETIENNRNNSSKKHDTVFVKTYHHSTNGNTFYNLYIIKDARAVTP